MTPDEVRRVSTMRRLAASGAARKRRLKMKLALRELAVLVRVSPGSLSRWETGLTRPRAAAALRWAAALDLTEERERAA